ncbi:MAG: MopE-related protein [bacterium]
MQQRSDDDCDGNVDEALAGGPLSRSCYDGPEGTEGVAACCRRPINCVAGTPGASRSQVLPGIEVCNGEDDDCDGRVDRTPAGDRLTQACYGGPEGTAGQGPCVAGVAECRFGQFEACVGEVLPAAEICDLADNDCNGQIDDVAGGCACQPRGAATATPVPQGPPGQEHLPGRAPDACPTGRASPPAMGPCCPGRRPATASMMTATARWMTPSSASASPAPTAWAPAWPAAQPPVTEAKSSATPWPRRRASSAATASTTTAMAAPTRASPWARPARRGFDLPRPEARASCGPDGALACTAQAGAPGAEQCSSLDDDCDGRADEDLANLGDCATGRPGVCGPGQRACQGGAEICTARAQAAAEQCDGLDNDCDGATDESQGQVPCGVGACARAIPACAGGAPAVCDPRVGAGDEICNGIDDDCDGSTDEGLGLGQPCGAGQGACAAQGRIICNAAGDPVCDAVAGQPRAEQCNGADDDCDGRTDEQALGVGDACSAGIGACLRAGARQCVAGSLTCDAVAAQPGAEACDAVDNDCDGRTDEGLGLGNACNVGVGACARAGQIACNGQGVAACNAAPGQPAAELCNSTDDDCDGRTDEQAQGAGVACSAGVGACLRPGTRQCVAGNLTCDAVAGQPGAEHCNAADDDCDGRTDEQPVDAGGACSAGNGGCAVNGTIACVAGALACDAVPRPPAAEVCDNQDQDCDGRADEGQPDCDGNGKWDACDLQFGRQRDCDGNGVPDACDIQGGAPDCDGDGILDACNDACAVDVTPPVVNLFVQGNPINRGTVIQIVVQAQDDVGVTACALTIAGQNIPLDAFCQAFVNFAQPGYFDVVGTARDAAGNEGRQTVRMRVLDPNDVAFPELTLHAPPNGSTIRQPTDVVASVQDANLVEWILSYGPQANPAANIISRGGQNVANQAIGVLDPAVIPVGQWALRLYAEDINGRSRTLTGSFTIAACVPAAEVCDGRDNDCDQRIDEQPVDAGGPCTAGEGVCERPGTVQCVAGATTCDAVPGQPAGAEACNRLDDDCDGRVDESQACPDVSPPRS